MLNPEGEIKISFGYKCNSDRGIPNEITNDYKTLPEVTQRSSMRIVSLYKLLVSFFLLSYFQRYAKPMFDHIQRETLLSLIFGTLFLSLLIIFIHIRVCHFSVSSKNLSESELKQAGLPPRGWNSYDAFSWIISEEEFLQNAQIVSQRLRPHGYEV